MKRALKTSRMNGSAGLGACCSERYVEMKIMDAEREVKKMAQ